MDMNGSNSNGVNSLESPSTAMIDEGSDVDDESRALLSGAEDSVLSKKPEKPKRKVRWLDSSGDNKLVQIIEFQPSDVSDSEEEDSDSCICRIM